MGISSEFNVDGKVFVVVGGGRGIGRGIVEVLAEAGCNGAAVAVTPKYVIPFAERVSKESGQTILGITADATKTKEMERVAQDVIAKFGKIDIWVNAAGDSIEEPLVPLPKSVTLVHKTSATAQTTTPISDDRFRYIFDLNFTTIHAGCRAVGTHFIQRRTGRVINIGSCMTRRGGATQTTYVAAKAGIEGFTRALALEWAPYGITVNCIAPGAFPDPDTMSPDTLAFHHEFAVKNVPIGRVGKLKEIGFATLFLASEAGAYITGQILGVDGGIVL